jgi:hypothetical protein
MREPAFRNPVSLAGAAVVTAAAMLFALLILLEWIGAIANPYVGLLTFVALPALLLAGLALVPFGTWREARLRRRRPERVSAVWPVIDLRDPRQRRVAGAILALTGVNLLIVSLAGYGGVHYMGTTDFCGRVCHTTMAPQFVAHQNAPHARIACVECHVGSGGRALIESKLAGARQLLHVVTNRVPTPIPTPVRSMRPARDTCERCHFPELRHGDQGRVIREYASDETSTELITRLTIHVGGGARGGNGTGIHWHMNLDNDIEYVATDWTRQEILLVRQRTRDGHVIEYAAAGATPERIAAGERRRMDCIDCHNRPAHPFDATPERAIDRAIAAGDIPRELPFVRREAVAAVSKPYGSREDADAGIAGHLQAFYAGQASSALVERAVAGARGVYARNVFPAMNVTFGTYPNAIGHFDAPGCFRCHDEQHKAPDGRVIRQDCPLCHTEPE